MLPPAPPHLDEAPPSRWRRVRAHLREAAVLDLRALALGRIGLALLLLYDLALRATDLEAHYTDAGVEPRSEVGRPELPLFRLYFLSGEASVTRTLFVMAATAATALLLGYRTRLATGLSWIFVASLQARNGHILQGGDNLLQMFLLWGLFLPLAGVWSLDARTRPPPTCTRITGAANFAFCGQLFMLYFITGTLKANLPHWRLGDGVWDALNADEFVTRFGLWLHPHRGILKLLGWGTLVLEILGPFVMLVPPRRWRVRLALVLSFIGLHLGITASMRIGMFSFVSIVGWLFLLPPGLFDRLHVRPIREGVAPSGSRWASRAAGVIFAYLVLAAMVSDRMPHGRVRDGLLKPARLLDLQEHWGMFVKPRAHSGFLVLEGTLRNGGAIDLLRGGAPVSFSPPPLVIDLFPNQRWRKWLTGLTKDKDAERQRAERFAAWLCRKENSTRPSETALTNVRVVYVKHPVDARGDDSRAERVTVASKACRPEG
ncbi:MAG: HTTM domain-containing protein [Myxococcales bacterium]|nr:HTTM domain-containing protein [Myxococcales bacterium]